MLKILQQVSSLSLDSLRVDLNPEFYLFSLGFPSIEALILTVSHYREDDATKV